MPTKPVSVCVRVAPKTKDFKDFVEIDGNSLSVPVTSRDMNRFFEFDKVFGEGTTQETVNSHFLPSIERFKDHINVSFIVYGHSGTGKSFTLGTVGGNGLIQTASSHIFPGDYRVSYLEIYNDQLQDLLAENGPKLSLRQLPETPPSSPSSTLAIENLSWTKVSSHKEFEKLFHSGNARRQTGRTAINDVSSRSHVILTFEDHTKTRLVFVDLGGSERLKISRVEGAAAKETIAINSSMAALVKVMGQLSQGTKHISFRDSKLTRILQPTFSGRAAVTLIACVSGDPDRGNETLSTLGYASDARGITAAPAVLPVPSLEKSMRQAVSQLEGEVKFWRKKATSSGSPVSLRPLNLANSTSRTLPSPPPSNLDSHVSKTDFELLRVQLAVLRRQVALLEHRQEAKVGLVCSQRKPKFRPLFTFPLMLLVLWLLFSPI